MKKKEFTAKTQRTRRGAKFWDGVWRLDCAQSSKYHYLHIGYVTNIPNVIQRAVRSHGTPLGFLFRGRN